MKKGDCVTYCPAGMRERDIRREFHFLADLAGRGVLLRDARVSAIVRRCHRDGSVTIEARHTLRFGKPHGSYLGFRYRMNPDLLTPAPAQESADV